MTPETVLERKGHLPMASPTKLAFNNVLHAYRIGSLLHYKNSGVAILAIQPEGMGKMGKDDIRYRIGDAGFKNDVQIQWSGGDRF